ncbi:MAG: hypothetical protein IKD36_02140 [Clostridia bacterium]|nr:hypothetical protein [Clostridia bacterium]
MISYISSLALMLAQTAEEKSLTYVGLAFFAGFLFFLIVDTTVKGRFVPKKSVMRNFLIVLFILVIIIIFMLFIFYK